MDDAIFSPDRGNEDSSAGPSDQPTPFYGGSSNNMSQRPGGPILPMSRDEAEEATSPRHSTFDSFDSHSGGPFIVPAAAMGHSSQYSNGSNNPAAISKFREAGLNPITEQQGLNAANNAGVGAAGGAGAAGSGYSRRVPPPSSNSHYSHTSGGSDVAYGGMQDNSASGSNTTPPLKSRQPQYAVANQDDIMQHTDGGPLATEHNAHQQSELPPTYASLDGRKEAGIANHQRLTSQETLPNPHDE